MNGKLTQMLSKIFGVVGILISIMMVGNIYTSNAAIGTAITAAVNSASFLILPDILPFGVVLILLGLVFSQIMLVWKGTGNMGIAAIVGTVLQVVGVILMLSFFPSIIDGLDGALTTIIAAADTINELVFGTIVPLIIYLAVIATSVATPVAMKLADGKKGGKKKAAAGAGAF